MDYCIVFKFNFICKLKLKLKFEIWNLKFEIAISICNLQFQITRVHNIHYMNLKGKLFFNQLWYGLHRFQIHFHLEIEIAVHLKEKVFFSLWYGLHHFQIQFHLQIEIAIWNFILHMCSYTIHEFGANFGKFTITNLMSNIWSLVLWTSILE